MVKKSTELVDYREPSLLPNCFPNTSSTITIPASNANSISTYALMELGLDAPDLPVAMLTDLHIKRCEEVLLEFVEKLSTTKEKEKKADAIWSDFSQRWFTLLHSTRPFVLRENQDLADHGASVLETVRDINVASRIIEDMTGATLDDPLSDRYKRLGCSISPLEKESEDYKMILKYVDKTYEPVKVGDISYGASVQNIFQVEVGAGPSYDEIKKLPNKVLLWCGTRSSNLVRHLHKGFLPAVCTLPVSEYMEVAVKKFMNQDISGDALAQFKGEVEIIHVEVETS